MEKGACWFGKWHALSRPRFTSGLAGTGECGLGCQVVMPQSWGHNMGVAGSRFMARPHTPKVPVTSLVKEGFMKKKKEGFMIIRRVVIVSIKSVIHVEVLSKPIKRRY